MSGMLSGMEAVKVVIQEIGETIGPRRLRELEMKTRLKMSAIPREDRTGSMWIRVIATVITEDDDGKADEGFRKGIQKVRSIAAGR